MEIRECQNLQSITKTISEADKGRFYKLRRTYAVESEGKVYSVSMNIFERILAFFAKLFFCIDTIKRKFDNKSIQYLTKKDLATFTLDNNNPEPPKNDVASKPENEDRFEGDPSPTPPDLEITEHNPKLKEQQEKETFEVLPNVNPEQSDITASFGGDVLTFVEASLDDATNPLLNDALGHSPSQKNTSEQEEADATTHSKKEETAQALNEVVPPSDRESLLDVHLQKNRSRPKLRKPPTRARSVSPGRSKRATPGKPSAQLA